MPKWAATNASSPPSSAAPPAAATCWFSPFIGGDAVAAAITRTERRAPALREPKATPVGGAISWTLAPPLGLVITPDFELSKLSSRSKLNA